MNILINDKFVNENEAQISILSDALMYGFGVFETLRTYCQKKTLKLENHIRRLIDSAKIIGLQLKYGFEEIQIMVNRVIQNSEYELQRVKILAIPEALIIISTKLEIDNKIYNGVSLKTIIHKRSLPQIKSTSYLDCKYYYNNAIDEGYYDALFIDENNYVYECSRSNLFWIKNKNLFTRQDNVLPGITRDIIVEISHIPFEYKEGKLSELSKAEEVFVTNSIIGIVPVAKLNDKNIGFELPGKFTKQLILDFDNKIN